MSYYISRNIAGSFSQALDRVREALGEEGFGVLTEIDVKSTMKQKLDEEFRNYRILGACNPSFAHKALSVEDKLGTMLPCNVIVQDADGEGVEVAAVDPVASMQAVGNDELEPIASEIRARLSRVVQSL